MREAVGERSDAVDHDLKDAQAHLPELFARALKEGPQRITRRGETVVMVSERDWTDGAPDARPRSVLQALREVESPSFTEEELWRFERPLSDKPSQRDFDLEDWIADIAAAPEDDAA